jgi:hypothetical protein
MNTMMVSPLLKVSNHGPLSFKSGDLIHLRQGDLDGACGPYCMISSLIALGVIRRASAQNMDQWDGRSREGRFRDALFNFGPLISEGTLHDDLLWLTEYFKGVGLQASVADGTKKQNFTDMAKAIDDGEMPIVRVCWVGGGAHWLLAVGYQGVVSADGEAIPTHLLCLDPAQESPVTGLWNCVLEIFDENGASANQGRFSSNHWGMDGILGKCQIKEAVILTVAEQRSK